MRALFAIFICLIAAPLAAHPHIFINTGLKFLIDEENRLTHVQIIWEYDELYSLLVTEDMGLDEDYDGVLSASDRIALTGFDMNWVQGFNGDLVAEMNGAVLALSGPTSPTAELTDGKIITSHMRAVKSSPVMDAPVIVRPYDGTYYTAYEVGLDVGVQGRNGCNVNLNAPDIGGALAMTKAELAALPEDMDMEAAGLGDIGRRFATEVTVTCDVQ
ncbi:DUF1007 family protein [Sulfitobacter donghicola]|uniref:Polyphosphate kinase n=1 Tax=Sulfitobacter donghicola DSW-25 = KCTC 12864 = JCM 14565 TaxID=1300350 RepID=A0A073IIX1_9RHOB|nr:DUF1007 family protein [Sulfitobacter donghicola]KEJ89709.1 polyphosphate kinase [Sulfitobacter donghicola DSW-25 = KCTC 12864 = JCM 14565]KIN67198.1 Polyphosphate kinase [Sulfitobacter donghicola DSW-25 = KCTC 12864 = JCM 14565]